MEVMEDWSDTVIFPVGLCSVLGERFTASAESSKRWCGGSFG